MSEAVSGKRLVYLFRKHSEASTASGAVLAYTKENGRSISMDADSTATKDGPIRTPGTPEQEIAATSVLKKGDTLVDALETAMLNSDLMDIWEANLDEPVPPTSGTTPTGKFKGKYFQGYITSFEKNSSAEDYVEISLTFGVNGKGAAGSVTVTEQQQEEADYVFADSVPSNSGDPQ